MNGCPKPFIQSQLAEDYCLCNSRTGHSKERFSELAISLKNIHTYYEWFSKPSIYSMIRLKIR
jgi:hypothetical protein